MQQGTGDGNGSDARTGVWTTVVSWLFAITLLVVSAGLVTWAIQGGIRMASAIEAEVEKDRARSEAPVLLIRPEEGGEAALIPDPPPPSGSAADRVPSSLPPLASAPTWLQRPEPSYPREAIRAGIEQGEVDLRCVARANGQIAFCAIASETPEGYGFGREAVRAAQDARMQPGEAAGEPVDVSVHFSVRFRLQ